MVELRRITVDPGVPVICYGLRTDFRTALFEGSRRLLELADSIEEVKVTCQFCNRKAIFNLRHGGGEAVTEGEQIQLGGAESYAPACFTCYQARTSLFPPLAGDANCDGFADVLIRQRSGTALHLGSAAGLSSKPAWTAELTGLAPVFAPAP